MINKKGLKYEFYCTYKTYVYPSLEIINRQHYQSTTLNGFYTFLLCKPF